MARASKKGVRAMENRGTSRVSGYRIDFTPDDNDTYLITSPDFPELTAFGEDEVGAMAAASSAIEEAIAARIARGVDVPVPSHPPG